MASKHKDIILTETIQDYLKKIYLIQHKKEKVTTNDIAESLGISAPSATNMIKKLSDMKLLDYAPYQGVKLTDTGTKIALEVIRHHRLIELYLVEALGYSWDEVHVEAERLEHVISEKLESKIAEFLGDPKFDPHGDPIPTKDGQIGVIKGDALSAFNVGDAVTILRISDKDPDRLRYLAQFGLYPGVPVNITRKEPYAGIMWVQIGESEHPLSLEIAREIYVEAGSD